MHFQAIEIGTGARHLPSVAPRVGHMLRRHHSKVSPSFPTTEADYDPPPRSIFHLLSRHAAGLAHTGVIIFYAAPAHVSFAFDLGWPRT